MSKRINILKYMLIIAAAITSLSVADNVSKDILFINSYHAGYSWSDNIASSFKTTIDDKLPECHIYVEYMDTQHFAYKEISDSFKKILKAKYRNSSIDLIVTSDDNATYFAIENYNDLFNDIPILFCGVNNYKPEEIYTNSKLINKITGIIEYTDFIMTCQTIRTINPDTHKVIFLVDNTPTGVGYKRNIEEQMAEINDLPFEIIDGKEYTTNEMINKAAGYDNNTAIISTEWFRDRTNDYFEYKKIITELSERCSSPIYITVPLENSSSSIGGYVNDPSYTGKILGKMAFDILDGKDIAEIPVLTKGTSKYLFNLDILRKHKIPLTKLPSGSDFTGGIDNEELPPPSSTIKLESWEKVWLNENPVLIAGIYNYPPLMITEDDPEGICIDYIKLLAKKIGIELKFDTSFKDLDNCLEAIRTKKEPDIIPGLTITPERNKYLHFSKTWLELQYALFVKSKESLIFYSGIESLSGKTIAVVRDSIVYQLLNVGYPDIKLKTVASVEDGLRAVSDGSVYGWIGTQTAGIYQAKTLGLNDVEIGTSLFELGKNKISIAVRNDKAILNGLLQKAIDAVTEEEFKDLRLSYYEDSVETDRINFLTVIKIAFAILPIFTGMVLYALLRLKRANNILSDSEERLKTTFQAISNAVITTDCDGNITRMNLVAEKITGWTIEEALKKKLNDVYYTIDSETDQEIPTPVSYIIENGVINITGDLALISKNKKRYQISENASPAYGIDGKPKGIVLVFKDITAQYEIERRIKQAERERELILENITVGICFLDRQMNIIRLNKKMAKYYKQPLNELIGQKCHNARFGKKNICPKCVVYEALLTGDICKGDFPYTPQGKEYEMIGVPIIEDNTITGVLEMIVDVTEYRKLQKNLKAANEQLKEHSDGLEQIIKKRTKELNKKNEQLNVALLELKQAQSQIILSERMTALAQLIAGIAHEINTPLGAIGSSGENIAHNMLYIIDNLTNISRWLNEPDRATVNKILELSINNKCEEMPLSTKETRAIRKKLEEELGYEKIANHRNVSRLLVDMNLYGQWKRFMPLLESKDCTKQLSELSHIVDICSSCNTIGLAVGKASRIVNALTNYIQSGNDNTEITIKEPINLGNSLQTVILLYQNKLKDAIELITEFEDVPEVLAIPDELNQVWANLLQNAVYAIENKGQIIIRLYQLDNGVAIDIVDNGCGMSKEVQKRLFEPLFTTKPPGEGTGLGMDIARKIIEENHNGTIDIKSEINKGTKVTVWLPTD